MLRSVVVVGMLVWSSVVGGAQVGSCHAKGTLCSTFDGAISWLPGKLVTTNIASCPWAEGVMLDCVLWDKKECIATDCIPAEEEKSDAQCRSVTAKDSVGGIAHSVNVFQERCNARSAERVVCCPPDSLESVLLAGYGAEPHEFPHQALLLSKSKWSTRDFNLGQCGGTIYNERWIITAAHCVVDQKVHPTYPNADPTKPLMFATPMEAKQLEVVVGSNIPGTAPAAHRYKVRRVIVHGNYSALEANQDARIDLGQRPDLILNDLALVELERKIHFNEDTLALPLAPPNFVPERYSDKLVIIGWGATNKLEIAEFLQKADVVIQNESIPNCKLPGFDAAQHLCVGGFVDGVSGKNAGGGDSGGPAICRDAGGKAVLCGVTSFGGNDEACSATPTEETCLPSVYADVSYFREWIVSNAGNQDTGRTRFVDTPLYGIDAPGQMSQVKVVSSNGKSCGGTLVGSKSVVTAAHCVLQESGRSKTGVGVEVAGNKYAVTGATLLSLSGKQRLERRNGKFSRRWEKWQEEIVEDPYFQSDVAVLTLGSKVVGVVPAVMSSDRLNATLENVYEVSWMRNDSQGLRKFPVNVVEKKPCESRYNQLTRNSYNFQLTPHDVCMTEKYSGGSSCDRAVGGGVFCGDKLCGVQVFRMCDFSTPKIITDISHLAAVIQDLTKGDESEERKGEESVTEKGEELEGSGGSGESDSSNSL